MAENVTNDCLLTSCPGNAHGVELSFREVADGYIEPFVTATGVKLTNVVQCSVSSGVDEITSITIKVYAVRPPEGAMEGVAETLHSAPESDPRPNPQWQPLAYRQWLERHPEQARSELRGPAP